MRNTGVLQHVLLCVACLSVFIRADVVFSGHFAEHGRRHAFASLLCDDDTLPAIEALGNSLREVGHQETLLVLVPESLSYSSKQVVSQMVNAQVLESRPILYPFASSSGRELINKPCRFLKLRLWGLTAWSKIVFLDADTIVRHNVKELFDEPGFSAVKDPVGMNYNTGLMVIEPSKIIHSLLLNNYVQAGSFNVGDQGALNALLAYTSWKSLPVTYNTFHTAAPNVLASAKVIHFSGDAKPWNFWKANGKGRIAYGPFLEWCKHARTSSRGACHMNGPLDDRELNQTVKKRYEDNASDSQMSVLLATYDREEWKNLTKFYGELEIVREIFVVWHKKDRVHEAPPNPKVYFIYPETDSLNNRYLSARLASNCVYICDDDVFPSRVALRMAFQVWRQNPGRLIGFYPRLWRSSPPEYRVGVAQGYNIVLTKGMFAHRSFLTAYNLFLPSRLAEIVNKYKNCEDILFNMMAVGMTGLSPIAVLVDKKIRDVGRMSGISGLENSSHLFSRDRCVADYLREGGFEEPPISLTSLLPAGYKNRVQSSRAERISRLGLIGF